MTGRCLLHASADVVDGSVREFDRVEMIDDEFHVGEPSDERSAVASGRIKCREADLRAPISTTSVEPTVQHVTRTALDHVEEPVTVKINDLRREDRPMI